MSIERSALHDHAGSALSKRLITEALRGPVIDLLARLVPEVARLPRHRAFDMVIDDCELLHRCFLSFRARRAQFRPLLVDARNRPVGNDNTPLACGRTLNEVVAMVVRSAARRHFRMRLGPYPRRPDAAGVGYETAPPAGYGAMTDRLMVRWGNSRREMAPGAPTASGDLLYDALKHTLLHDWQALLIPLYARMTARQVCELGSRLLDFRSPAQLEAYLENGQAWPDEDTGVHVAAMVPPSMRRRSRLLEVI